MDYTELSYELLQTIYRYYTFQTHRRLNSAMHGEAFALQYIAQNDDAVVPSDIESAMNVSSARIATVLNGLENKKWITRRIDPQDRRRTILKLTPMGEEQAAKSSQQLLILLAEILEYLGESDAKDYVRIMGRLAERCNGVLE
jgi:Transcriptional regulators